MLPADPRRLDWYQTPPDECPYLPGLEARRIVVDLAEASPEVYDFLVHRGFRRDGHWGYRPSCDSCAACISIRLVLARFRPDRSMRRAAKANAALAPPVAPPIATAERWELFRRYIRSRHGDGSMALMGEEEFRLMIESSPVDTALLDLRDGEGTLFGVVLFDRFSDGLSAVYSFFDPEPASRSLGTFAVLALAGQSRAEGLPYLYLGYWVAGSRKMDYKARYGPLEAWDGRRWRGIAPPRPKPEPVKEGEER